MFGILAVLLATAAVVLLFVVIAAVFDVAMGTGYSVVEQREREFRRWRPPYVRGPELLSWARSTAAEIVRDVVAHGIDERAPATLAQRLNRGAHRAMLPDSDPRDEGHRIPCPSEGQGIVGVSALEAIQLADSLRTRLTSTELQELRDQSEANARLISDRLSGRSSNAPCSLQGDDCLCLAFDDRPLACRPLHATMLAKKLGYWSVDGDPDSTRERGQAAVVGRGFSQGLADGLGEAGLDPHVYELHGALVAAIDQPDAALKWLQGGEAFGDCRPFGTEVASGPALVR